MSKPSVLVVGTIDRPDILAMLDEVRGHVRLDFVEYRYNYGVPLHPERYAPYGSVTSWDRFRSAWELLDHVRPDRIAFVFHSALTQLALKLAAQRRGITTYHLEHGHRMSFEDHVEFVIRRGQPRRLPGFVSRGPRQASAWLKENAFFWRTLQGLDAPTRLRAASYALGSYRVPPKPTTIRSYGDILRVDEYINCGPADFEQHWGLDDLSSTNFGGVHFIGAPQFDDLSALPEASVDPRKLMLIDHQFHTGRICGWNLEYRKAWVARLAEIVRRLGLHLVIKSHPGDTSDAWRPHLEPGVIELTDRQGLREHITSTRVVLGNFSSMQMPLAALAHTVLITLEIHPEAGHFLSRGFVRSGVARAVTTFEELEGALRQAEVLWREQTAHKASYVERYLHRADGRAGVRLRDVLTGRGTPVPAAELAARRARSSL